MNVRPYLAVLAFCTWHLSGVARGDEWAGLAQGSRYVYSADVVLRAAFDFANPGALPERQRRSPGAGDTSFDWTEALKVAPPLSQKDSPNCWAFAAVGAFEYAWVFRNGNKGAPRLSVQPILDRTGRDGATSSSVALADLLAHGTCKADVYPFSGHPRRLRTGIEMPYRLAAWGPVSGEPISSVQDLKAALVEHGPLVAALEATPAFLAHRTGVLSDQSPSPEFKLPGHAVVIIGWNDNLGKAGAWKVQNSWGRKWGINGLGWIEYGSCKIGASAYWMRAQSVHYALPDDSHKLVSPTADPFPRWPGAIEVSLAPKKPYPRADIAELTKHVGEPVTIEFLVKAANLSAGDAWIELYSEAGMFTDPKCVAVRIRKFDGVKGSTKSSESERSVEARLRHSMDEYKGRRVRVHGLVQRGIEARTGIPTIDVWQPTQIEVLR
jgi:hypothetical protein